MPPAPKRDVGLILFDVASSKKQELLNGLLKFASFKYFLGSKSIYRLILVNSEDTHNDKNFSNMFTTDITDLNPTVLLKAIQKMSSGGTANLIDALNLGIYHLEEAVELTGLITLQLIFFTDLENFKVVDVKESVDKVISSINANEIYMYFIGPEINQPYVISNQQSISKNMKNFQLNKGNKSLVMAHKIVTSTKYSIICNTNIGVHLLYTFKKFPGGQPWKVPISFGTQLKIPAKSCKIYRNDICLKIFCPEKETVKYVEGDRNCIIDDKDIVKGLVRHGKFLEINNAMFKEATERTFEILGFSEKKFVPESCMLGEDTYYVLPECVTEDSYQAFIHLVKVLHDQDKYAIAKRVYSNNLKAKYYVLIPEVRYEPKCFIMTELPFAGDLEPHKSSTPLQPKKILDEGDAFYKFCKSVDTNCEDSNGGVAMGPMMMIDLYQQKLINLTTKKFLEREEFDLDSLDINDYELEANNNYAEIIKSSWPVRSDESLDP